MKKDVKQFHPDGAGWECYKSPAALPFETRKEVKLCSPKGAGTHSLTCETGMKSSNLILMVRGSLRKSCSLTCETRNEVQQLTVVLGEGPIRTQKSCSLTCETRKEIHQLGPGGTREPLRNPAAPQLGLRERGYPSEVAQPHTVRKNDIILRSIERMLQTQLSMARKFPLWRLRRYSVKYSKVRNFTFNAPWTKKTK
jgi:hypothetical protein